MTDNLIKFPTKIEEFTVTSVMEKVTEQVKEFEDLIVIARYPNSDKLFFAASYKLCKDVLWELEIAKKLILE